MSRRTGLGRGLAALIPPASERRDRDDTGPVETPSGSPTEDEPAERGAGATDAGDRPGPPEANAPDDGSVEGDDAGHGGTAAIGEVGTSATVEGEDDPDEGAVRVLPAGSDVPGSTESAVSSSEPRPGAQPDAQVAASTATYAEVPPGQIRPNPRQPRDVFDPEELQGLAISLADIGVLQPLVVRPLGSDTYELIAGERRLRAATLAGLDVVPVLIRHTDDQDLLKEALVENIHRVQLNPLEEAAAYEQLLEEFGVTQEELAARLGRSRPAISNALRLLRLPTQVQRRVAAGVLSAGHAKALLTLDDPAAQAKLAERIVAEGLSVRATEELVRLKVLDGAAPTRRSRSKVTAPGLVDLQDDLSDALEARVRITMGARKGKLAIEFGSVDDLERIVAIIADGLGQRRGGRAGTPGSPPPAV
jgi:ParB family chromosome partitioning protein